MIPSSLNSVQDALKPLIDRFEEQGFRLYLVGGVVRDALLGQPLEETYDIDLTTDARPDQIVATAGRLLKEVNLAGERYGTVAGSCANLSLEITTHRAEVYVAESRKPDVRFSTSIEEDLARRDFTINAMAVEITGERPHLIDPFGGRTDLENGKLRTPLSPEISFAEDPLRMLRAARFITRLGLQPQRGLLDAVRTAAGRLSVVSSERIRDEFDRLLCLPDPSAGLWFIVNTGLANQFLPELPALAVEQDPVHRHKDVLAHTIAVVKNCSPTRRLRLAALLHDIGKPATRLITPEGVQFHFHDAVGAKMARKRLEKMRYPKELVSEVATLVALHLRFHSYAQGWSDSAVRRYVRDAGHLYDDLNELTLCDATTRNENKLRTMHMRMGEFKARVRELQERDDLAKRRPPLSGDEVMALLEIGPSRTVGDALEMLFELELENGTVTKEEATTALLSWWSSYSPDSKSTRTGRPRRNP